MTELQLYILIFLTPLIPKTYLHNMDRAARHDLYSLKVYRFRRSKNEWKRTSKRDQEEDPPSAVHIVTWNIDFQSQWPEDRLLAVLRHLEEDVFRCRDGEAPPACCILLQEVHVRARDKIMEDEWVRDHFFVTDSHKWRSDTYGNLTLIDKSITVLQAKQLDFGWSQMDRAAIVTDLKLRTPRSQDIVVRIVNTHLESMREGDVLRPFQLAGCAQVLKDDGIRGGIVAGDMNAIGPGDDRLPQQNGLRDAWWRNDSTGNTWGYQGGGRFPKGRLDKILYTPNRGFRVSEPEKIGVGVKANGLYASDHYGLMTTLTVMQ